MSKLQPWPEFDPQGSSAGGTMPPPGGPTTPAGDSNDPYSMDWTKKLPAFYAKNWGGEQGSEQAWYRTPEWAGGVVWNPYWGWQSGSDIKGKYGQGQLSAEDFYGMGLTRNPGEDWQQYYEQLTGMTPEAGKAKQNANYGGTTGTAGGEAMPNTQDWSSLFSSYFPEYGQTQGYTYPDEMNWATDVLGEYAYTGRPTSWSPWYQQAKKGVETDVMDAIKQAAEKAGLGGTRWSTPMGRTAQDISSRAYQDLGTQFMGLETGALENAANRGLTAAQTLPGVAQLRQQMPMDYASNLMGMGQGMNQSYNQMLSPLQQEWMRTQPEYSPWNQYGGGLLGATMGGPQMYQQGCMSQLLGATTGGLGIATGIKDLCK